MRRSNHENIDVLMLIGLVTEEGGEGEGEGGKSNSKVGTRWVRQQHVQLQNISLGLNFQPAKPGVCCVQLQTSENGKVGKTSFGWIF